jgi:hypothetical protein
MTIQKHHIYMTVAGVLTEKSGLDSSVEGTPFEANYVPPADELDTKTEATLIINFL